MRYWKILSACILPAAVGLAAMSAPVWAEKDEKGFVRTRPEQIDLSKTGIVVIEGNPEKPGIYVVRVKFEPGHFSMPHWHNTDRHIVVLKGTWYMGVGEKFDPSTAVPMPVGSYVKHPAGAVHWDGAMNEEVVLQIIGEGPVTTDMVDKDKPMFVQVK